MATYNLIASKDAYTRGGTYANTNFGTEPVAHVKNDTSSSASRKAWFGFDLSGVVGTVTSATLRLYCTYGVSQDEDIHLVTEAWTESGITWNNEPSVGDLIDTVNVSTGDVTSIDVTDEVNAALSGGEISFRVTRPTQGGSQDIIEWGTRENTNPAVRPVLVVVTEEEAGSTSLAPTDDATVRAGTHADTPQTNEDPLLVKWDSVTASNTREVLFRFDLTGIDKGALTAATFKFHVELTGEPDQPISIYYCDDSDWDEETVTWNTKPEVTTLVHSEEAVNGSEWVQADVLAAIQAEPGNAITFLIRRTSSSSVGTDTVVINSKEAEDPSVHPVLVLQEATPSPNPVALDDSATCVAGQSVSIGVLLNDIATSAALDPSTVTVTEEPPNGTTSVNTTTGRITYTPDQGFTGQDVFRYTVKDLDGNTSNQARVTVTVTPDTSEPYDFEITPVADTYTRGGSFAAVNYASDPELYVKEDPTSSNRRYTFLRFDLSQITTEAVDEALLRLYATATGNPTVNLHVHTLPNSWTEGTLTYNNMPTPGDEVGSFTATGGEWSELDVTDAVNAALAGNRKIQFRIAGEAASGNPIVVFASRENPGVNIYPRLLITGAEQTQNSAPMFISTPVTTATEGEVYVYNVRAMDPDGQAVTLTDEVLSVPGLAFSTTGLPPGEGIITGVPTTPGDYSITIRASDGSLHTDQTFTLVVAAAAPVGDMEILDDAYVQGGTNADTNYGDEPTLYIKNDTNANNYREALIKVDCSGFTAEEIGTATLHLFCELAAESGIVLRVERYDDDEWDEDTVTFNTKPEETHVVIGSDVEAVEGQWLLFNITGGAKTAAEGDGTLSLRIYATNRPGTNPIVGLSSKESTDPAARPYVTVSAQGPVGIIEVDDAFLVAGQSNAMGAGDATLSPIPYEDTAFMYDPVSGTFSPLRDPVGQAMTGSAWPAFAREWYELTGRTLALVSMAEGNTPNSALIRDRNWESGPLLEGAIAAMNQMLAKISGSPDVAVLWSQGERDGKAILEGWPPGFTAETYRSAFLSTINTFRSQGWRGFVLVISETGTNTELGDVGYADVRQVQREVAGLTEVQTRVRAHFDDGGVAESAPITLVVSGGGAEDVITGFAGAVGFPARGMMSDSLHYTQDGYDEMGRAMAHALAVYRGYIEQPDPPPVFESQPIMSVRAGTLYEYAPVVSGATEVTVPVRPGWMTVTGTGTSIMLRGWAPFGTYNVSIRAEGPGGVTFQSYILTAFSIIPQAKDSPVIVIENALGGQSVNYLSGSVSINTTLGQHGTLDFAVNGRADDIGFEVMDAVIVFDSPARDVRVFRGFIESIEEVEPMDGGYMQCRVRAVDANAYADRMLVSRTYEHMTAGEIVRDILIRTIGSSFGVQAGTVANGPVIEHAEFSYRKVTDALNALADVAGFMWWIDHDLKLHFNVREAYEAPFAITDTTKYYSNLTVTRTMEGYRNRQIVAGDLSAEDPVIALRQDYNEVLSKGPYWDFVQEGAITQNDADTLAQALLVRYSRFPRRIRFTTDKPGLRAGQQLPINLPYRGLNGSFLILSVRAYDRGDYTLRYDVEATDGGDEAAWAKQFKAYAQGRALLAGAGGEPGTEPPPATHTFADGITAGFHASIRVNGGAATTGTGSIYASGRRLFMMMLAGATSNPIEHLTIGSSDAPMPDNSVIDVDQMIGSEPVTHSEITTTSSSGDTVLLRAIFQPNQARTIREIGAWSPGNNSAPVGRATIPATTCEAGDLLTVEVRISFTSGG